MKKITLLFSALFVGLSMNAQITITHSTSQNIVEANTVACPTEPTSYWRVFDLENQFSITEAFEVTEIQFGVEVSQTSPITLRLYTSDGIDPTVATLDLVYSEDITIAASDELTVVSHILTTPVTLPASSILAVELEDTEDGTVFRIGSNQDGETADSWLTSPTCGSGSVGSFGFTNHYVLNVIGDEVLSVGDNLADLVSIYPVPATDVINVKVPSNIEVIEVKLYDLLGRDAGAVYSNEAINVSNLDRGVYLLTVNTSEGTLTQKVIKK